MIKLIELSSLSKTDRLAHVITKIPLSKGCYTNMASLNDDFQCIVSFEENGSRQMRIALVDLVAQKEARLTHASSKASPPDWLGALAGQHRAVSFSFHQAESKMRFWDMRDRRGNVSEFEIGMSLDSVKSSVYDPNTSSFLLANENGKAQSSRLVSNATGMLSRWNLPDLLRSNTASLKPSFCDSIRLRSEIEHLSLATESESRGKLSSTIVLTTRSPTESGSGLIFIPLTNNHTPLASAASALEALKLPSTQMPLVPPALLLTNERAIVAIHEESSLSFWDIAQRVPIASTWLKFEGETPRMGGYHRPGSSEMSRMGRKSFYRSL